MQPPEKPDTTLPPHVRPATVDQTDAASGHAAATRTPTRWRPLVLRPGCMPTELLGRGLGNNCGRRPQPPHRRR